MTDYAAPVAGTHAARGGLGAWLTTTDHKRIGVLYILTSLAFFLVAVVFAMLMRTQLIVPRNTLLSAEAYNQIFTMHGTTMIFLFGMPLIIGVANYIVPLQIGARDMAFPRANALSYWLLLFGGLLLYSSFLFGGAVDTGWFSYAPLTLKAYSPHDGVTFWIVSLLVLGASSILGSINFIVTCLRFRAKGMRLRDMPIFSIATFINSFLILFAFPSLTAAIVMLYFDRQFGTSFFDPAGGGDPLIWQHLFWFFGHPEVYILVLPAFGVMSEVVPIYSRKPLFGRESMIVMLGVIGFLGFLVWAHHMFATGLPNYFNVLMAGSSMLIAIPTGVKIFNWLATMWGGSLRFQTPLLFACGLIALFTVGGITGVTLATVPFDWQVTDTYYVVGHFHNVLFAGTVFALFAGIYYWFPKMFGRKMDDRLGKWHFWLIIVGFLVTFMPMYMLGFLGMPRRVYTYDADLGWNTLNLISSIGGYIIAVSILIFLYNFVTSLRSGEVAGNDPWRGWTLEWATTSPPPHGNFTSLPVVHSERPLYDLEQEEAAAAEGGPPPDVYTLPAEPEQSTPVPFWLAVGILILAVGLLTSWVVLVIGVGVLLVVAAVWMSAHWTEPEIADADRHRFTFVGAGMLAFIGSESVFFASLIAAAVHLRIHNHTLGQQGFDAVFPAINTIVLFTSGVTAHYMQVAYRKHKAGTFYLLLVLTLILGSAFLGGQAYEYTHLGLGLTANLAVSSFFVLTGFHGFHVLCGLLVLLYLLVRAARERKVRTGASLRTSAMVDAGTYYWHFVDAVWVAVFVVVYLL